MNDKIRVIELFAGVGGFRLGLERASERYQVVWSNQWEPSTKTQHASLIYVKNFGSEHHSNEDLSKVPTDTIPDHDLLVGGFPCQDYSVARTLNHAKGLQGKKGVLWWEIHRILEAKRPRLVFLENVDRLLKSPAKQRGRDFAIMLASLSDLGYMVEWRVINAADYGMPQRRRRIFILAYQESSPIYRDYIVDASPEEWVTRRGVFAETFPVLAESDNVRKSFEIEGPLDYVSEHFNKVRKPDQMALFNVGDYFPEPDSKSPFENSGMMINRLVHTIHAEPNYEGEKTTLGDIVLTNGDVPPEYYLTSDSLDRWAYLKGAKNERRRNKATGFEYEYTEGPMVFPDPLDRPSRTIITGEGGPSPSRFKHVVRDAKGHLRRLTPIELERLNMFPDNHTEGVSDIRRAFFMGNALVVGIIERIGKRLSCRFER